MYNKCKQKIAAKLKLLISVFNKKIKFSNFWVRNGLILIVVSILANHLVEPANFPLNESYRFPWYSILISIVLGGLIMAIAALNFNLFKKKYFTQKINTRILLRFLLTTLGYITIVYIFLYYLVNGFESSKLYYLLTGFSITLLLSVIAITILFSNDIYKLYKFTTIKGKFKIEYNGKITLVNFDEITFVYSENKIVYVVKTDGTSIITGFTLNEIEDKLSKHSFYRANRQTILHAYAIEEVQSIENNKLSVLLKSTISRERTHRINISRYKKQDFLKWFENKS